MSFRNEEISTGEEEAISPALSKSSSTGIPIFGYPSTTAAYFDDSETARKLRFKIAAYRLHCWFSDNRTREERAADDERLLLLLHQLQPSRPLLENPICNRPESQSTNIYDASLLGNIAHAPSANDGASNARACDQEYHREIGNSDDENSRNQQGESHKSSSSFASDETILSNVPSSTPASTPDTGQLLYDQPPIALATGIGSETLPNSRPPPTQNSFHRRPQPQDEQNFSKALRFVPPQARQRRALDASYNGPAIESSNPEPRRMSPVGIRPEVPQKSILTKQPRSVNREQQNQGGQSVSSVRNYVPVQDYQTFVKMQRQGRNAESHALAQNFEFAQDHQRPPSYTPYNSPAISRPPEGAHRGATRGPAHARTPAHLGSMNTQQAEIARPGLLHRAEVQGNPNLQAAAHPNHRHAPSVVYQNASVNTDQTASTGRPWNAAWEAHQSLELERNNLFLQSWGYNEAEFQTSRLFEGFTPNSQAQALREMMHENLRQNGQGRPGTRWCKRKDRMSK